MSTTTITIDQVKAFLHIDGTADDERLQLALDGAIEECKRFCNRNELPTLPLEYVGSSSEEEYVSSEDPEAPDVRIGIFYAIAGMLDGDPARAEAWRKAAETKWQPYRDGMGV
jgi:hypothetical protein